MTYVGANPTQAIVAGQDLQAMAQTAGGARGNFSSAAQEAGGAAAEATVAGAYPTFEANTMQKINAVLGIVESAGVNVQVGGGAAGQTDNDSHSGFQQAQNAIPGINRGALRAV